MTITCWRFSALRGYWGAVAKSNFSGLRYREPVYRTLRELVMSYFEHYYNLRREKTLRNYSRPVNLRRFDRIGWMTAEEDVWASAGISLHHRPHSRNAAATGAAPGPRGRAPLRRGIAGARGVGLSQCETTPTIVLPLPVPLHREHRPIAVRDTAAA